ncbi:stage II sporulation protein P [Halalkalibacter krulwichiae]|uniref:Stage II sporulation protein P (SpoIIP) n=1 Tax=Halalkalibacter krulwichiae TaxID=199441 RepID=A0A1X9MIB1_9BACI|nr:stage II sporulation protein P [Halalkalibacter krulwichiae]ARK31361.1 Stage II sporulation protein P (SpoIIP) [Halalkalibacter krulwichiae]
MNKKEESNIIEQLKREHSKITPRDQFVRELEETLVKRFSKRNKNKLSLPAFALIFSTLIFSMLVFNLGSLNEGTSALNSDNPQVYIYHTHNTESFLPDLNVDDGRLAFDEEINITLVGQHLSNQLEGKNIRTIHDNTDFVALLQKQNLEFRQAYELSKINVERALEAHDSLKMVFDIHRDSTSSIVTTTTINNQEVAKLLFVVSRNHDGFEENLKFAELIHKQLEEKYPGLSREF